MERNVLGGPLAACSYDPLTGYYRDGACRTGEDDPGSHIVCARMTAQFLEFSAARGNDLSTPHPEQRFRGLRPEATHESALDLVPLEELERHAFETH